MSDDLVSIIMPCHNAAPFIKESVASVLAQTHADFELLIVDDGSTDDSLESIAQFKDPRIKTFRQDHRGVSHTRNHALRHAKGTQVAFLDADDTWSPFLIQRLNDALKQSPAAAIAYCGWQNVGINESKPYVPPDYEMQDKIEALLQACPWPIHAALTRMQAIHKTGGFDEHRSHAEDYELWLNIACFEKIVRVPEVLAFYRHSNHQASRNRVESALQCRSVQCDFIQKNAERFKQNHRFSELIDQGLLNKAYQAYWKRELKDARTLFILSMKAGYMHWWDLKYMLPALLPIERYKALIAHMDRRKP